MLTVSRGERRAETFTAATYSAVYFLDYSIALNGFHQTGWGRDKDEKKKQICFSALGLKKLVFMIHKLYRINRNASKNINQIKAAFKDIFGILFWAEYTHILPKPVNISQKLLTPSITTNDIFTSSIRISEMHVMKNWISRSKLWHYRYEHPRKFVSVILSNFWIKVPACV